MRRSGGSVKSDRSARWTTAPSVLLHVKTTIGSPADAVIEVTNTATQATVQAKSNGATLQMTAYGSAHGGTYAGTSFNSLSLLESGGAHLMVSYDAGHVLFVNGTIETARLTHNGNLLTGTTAEPGTGTMAHVFGDGTAPATMGSNTAAIYGEDVAGTVKMFCITEAGVSGQIAILADITAAIAAGVRGEVPSGTINGVNTVFGTAAAYTGLCVYVNGLRQKLTTHYTLTTATSFTFTSAPIVGDLLTVDYN